MLQMLGMSFMTQGQTTTLLNCQDGIMHGSGKPEYSSDSLKSELYLSNRD